MCLSSLLSSQTRLWRVYCPSFKVYVLTGTQSTATRTQVTEVFGSPFWCHVTQLRLCLSYNCYVLPLLLWVARTFSTPPVMINSLFITVSGKTLNNSFGKKVHVQGEMFGVIYSHHQCNFATLFSFLFATTSPHNCSARTST